MRKYNNISESQYVDFVCDYENIEAIKDIIKENYNFELVEAPVFVGEGKAVEIKSKKTGEIFDHVWRPDATELTEDLIDEPAHALWSVRVAGEPSYGALISEEIIDYMKTIEI